MRFDDKYLSKTITNVAQVQKQQKRVHYSITRIGGAAELAKWKADQELAEQAYQAKMVPIRKQRRDSVVAMVEANVKGEAAPYKLTPAEQAEVDWKKSLVARPVRPQVSKQLWMPESAAPVSLFDRAVNWLSSFWKAANFSS